MPHWPLIDAQAAVATTTADDEADDVETLAHWRIENYINRDIPVEIKQIFLAIMQWNYGVGIDREE